jgi:hypothetical protein
MQPTVIKERPMRVVSNRAAGAITRRGLGQLSLCALALAVLLATPGGAQQAAGPARVPVFVLLVDSLPVPDARAVIVRQSSGPVNDYILLTRRTATARQLSAAVFTLLTVHATGGTVPNRSAVVRVRAAEGPAAWIETEERRAEAMVRRLHRASPRYVPGFGFVPAVRLTVPARAMQGRLRTKT